MTDLDKRIDTLARWMLEAEHLVFFSGAGISTESGVPDFRGPDGIWTRRDRGLPPPPRTEWANIQPNQAHLAITELQNLGRLKFLITQNIDNLHLLAGIRPELIAEFHGNIMKLRCTCCDSQIDNFPDLMDVPCPICEKGRLVSSVVDFGDSIPVKAYHNSVYHAGHSDCFVVAGSSLAVNPAASMPQIACNSGAKLVIINDGETPYDRACHLRFRESTGKVLPSAVARLKDLLESGSLL